MEETAAEEKKVHNGGAQDERGNTLDNVPVIHDLEFHQSSAVSRYSVKISGGLLENSNMMR